MKGNQSKQMGFSCSSLGKYAIESKLSRLGELFYMADVVGITVHRFTMQNLTSEFDMLVHAMSL